MEFIFDFQTVQNDPRTVISQNHSAKAHSNATIPIWFSVVPRDLETHAIEQGATQTSFFTFKMYKMTLKPSFYRIILRKPHYAVFDSELHLGHRNACPWTKSYVEFIFHLQNVQNVSQTVISQIHYAKNAHRFVFGSELHLGPRNACFLVKS